MCLLLGGLAALLFYPPAWHGAVRTWLNWQAEEQGLRLEIASLDGTPLDVTVLHGVRLHTVDAAAGNPDGSPPPPTDLRIRRAEFVLAPALPWFGQPRSSWLERIVLEGVEGSLALESFNSRPRPARFWPRLRDARMFTSLARRLAPRNFELVVPRDSHLVLRRGQAEFRARGLRLSGYKDAPGVLLAREVEARAPGGLDSVYHDWHATTRWTGERLTVNRLALAPGIELQTATLDASQVRRKLLNGDLTVRALGGTLRSQVKARLPGARGTPNPGHWQFEIAGSLESMAVRPLTELFGFSGPTGGVVRAGVFSFSGDPADLPAAAASLRMEVTDFQWGARRWQRLLLAATVLHRRITVHELDLVQRRNRLVLNGEGPLPAPSAAADVKAAPGAADPAPAADTLRFGLPPWLDNFSCNLDARIDDLEDFALLLGPGFGLPELAGRMNAQGTLTGRDRTLDGYLKITAGPLRIRRAPLDRLRATMTFRGDELQITDVEAVRNADSLLGKGTFQLGGSGRYTAEGRVNVRDLAPYQPAFASYGFPEPRPTGALNLEWSGDGAPGAHSGAFRGRLNNFLARAGRAALPRRIDLEADGTYSPDSVSFRQLTLRDLGESNPTATAATGAKKPKDAPNSPQPAPTLRFEGVALPFSQRVGAEIGAAGWPVHLDGKLVGRVLLAEFPVELLPPLLPGVWREAAGRLSGWIDLGGTPRAPQLNGQLSLRKARLRWTDPQAAAWLDADTAPGGNAPRRTGHHAASRQVDRGASSRRRRVGERSGGVAGHHDPAGARPGVAGQKRGAAQQRRRVGARQL